MMRPGTSLIWRVETGVIQIQPTRTATKQETSCDFNPPKSAEFKGSVSQDFHLLILFLAKLYAVNALLQYEVGGEVQYLIVPRIQVQPEFFQKGDRAQRTLGEAVLWHAAVFNDAWVADIPSTSDKTLWTDLRRNAATKARNYLGGVADLSKKQGMQSITDALEESADTLRNYRGSLCGTEVCVRLAIQIQVLTKVIQDADEELADESTSESILQEISEKTNCPEILRSAKGELVR